MAVDMRINDNQAATIVVAAHDSLHPERADYVCGGADDQVEIQTAMDALPSAGGKVLLMEGTFDIQAKLVLDQNICLVGMGMFSTKLENNSGDYAIEIFLSGSYARNIEIGDFEISFGANATGGIHINSAKRCSFHDILISGSNNVDVGVDYDGGSDGAWYNTFQNIIIYDISNAGSTGKGIYAHSGVGISNNITMLGSEIRSCDYNVHINNGNGHNFHGINIEAGGTRDIYCNGLADFYGCRIENVGANTIECTASGKLGIYGGRVTGAYLTGTLSNILYLNGSKITSIERISHIYFADVYDSLQACVDAAPDGSTILLGYATYGGIVLDDRDHLHFIGIGVNSSIIAGVATYGVHLTIESRRNTFENLRITSTGTYALRLDTYCTDIVFRACRISSTASGAIYYGFSGARTGHELINCHIAEASGYGIHCTGSTDASGPGILIDGCLIENTSDHGIRMQRAHGVDIRNTTVREPTGVDKDAIRLESNATDVRIFGCDLVPSGIGLPISDSSPSSAIATARYSDLFMDVLAVSATHVRSNEDLSAATPITFTIDAQPDVPRTLSWSFDSHAQITEYDMEVIGVDAKGNAVTETWDETAGWSGETSNAFATITSIKMTSRTGTGVADTMDIGITDVLGLSNVIYSTSDVFKIKKNNANATAATAQVNTTYDTYDMSVMGLAATDDFTIWYKSNLNIIS